MYSLLLLASVASHRVKKSAALLSSSTHIPVVVLFVQLFPCFDRPVFSFVRSFCETFFDVFPCAGSLICNFLRHTSIISSLLISSGSCSMHLALQDLLISVRKSLLTFLSC